MKPLCIYHANCDDGFAAAWAVRRALGDKVDFHPGNYAEPPPMGAIAGRKVIMVDFSYKRPIIEAIAADAQSILILDHHRSAEIELAGYPSPPRVPDRCGWLPDSGVYVDFYMDRCGAILAWDHFNPEPPPDLLYHIQDRDLWRHALAYTTETIMALRSYPQDFDVWDKLISGPISRLRIEGTHIKRYHDKNCAAYDNKARTMLVADQWVPAINLPWFMASDVLHVLAIGEPFAVGYFDEPEYRQFSLRSDDLGMDVQEVAKQYGGGGHPHAAGFMVPFDQLRRLGLE